MTSVVFVSLSVSVVSVALSVSVSVVTLSVVSVASGEWAKREPVAGKRQKWRQELFCPVHWRLLWVAAHFLFYWQLFFHWNGWSEGAQDELFSNFIPQPWCWILALTKSCGCSTLAKGKDTNRVNWTLSHFTLSSNLHHLFSEKAANITNGSEGFSWSK